MTNALYTSRYRRFSLLAYRQEMERRLIYGFGVEIKGKIS